MLCMWLIKGLKSVAAEDYERMCVMCVQVYSTSVQYKCTVQVYSVQCTVYSVQCTVQGLGEDVRYVSEE